MKRRIKNDIKEIDWKNKNTHILREKSEKNFIEHCGKEEIENTVAIFRRFLNEKIEDYTKLLSDLKEIEEKADGMDYFYMVCDYGSHYGYIDKEYNTYTFKEINGKPMLIDKEYNLYEIIEVFDIGFLTPDTIDGYWCDDKYINKVVKVKRTK